MPALARRGELRSSPHLVALRLPRNPHDVSLGEITGASLNIDGKGLKEFTSSRRLDQ